MIIGVDRLDYSKGLNLRLDAYEQFLRQLSELARQGDVPADHAEEPQRNPRIRRRWSSWSASARAASTAPTARRTGRRSATSTAPTAAPRSPGFYRGARAGLVTPLRDGMNLVAKEYVAAQDPEDPGVLVLSRFAGAAHECKEALLVNPYDTEAVAAAINRALAMPLDGAARAPRRRCTRRSPATTSRTGPSASSRR